MDDANCALRSLVRIRSRMDKGPRATQQDRFAYRTMGSRTLLVVADGMGGHDHGEKAAVIAVDAFIDVFTRPGSLALPIADVLNSCLDAADRNMKADPAANMGTTVVAAILDESNPLRFAYTWVGDSRLYLLSENSAQPNISAIRAATPKNSSAVLWLLTRDDSLVWGLYASGEISIDDLSRHPMKNRLRHSLFSLGDVPPARIEEARLAPGDRILLCTDGVWESFPSQHELLRCWNVGVEESHQTLSAYLDAAVRSGLCSDNNSYLLADLLVNGPRSGEERANPGGCAE